MTSISFSSELLNPRVVKGAPKSVANWSEMRMALGTLNLSPRVSELVSEVKADCGRLCP